VLTYRRFFGVLAGFSNRLHGVFLWFGVGFWRTLLRFWVCVCLRGWRLEGLGLGNPGRGFFEDDEEDDANMDMAVDQFQNFIPPKPPSRRAAGGSRQGRATNIERDRVIMDAQRLFC
jgi:hypothetical protein